MVGAKRDYYDVLGVKRDADAKAIKDAFRALALQYHPDRNKAPGAEERFKEVSEAYAVLADPEKRAAYDLHGFPGVAGISDEDLFRTIDFRDLFGGLGIAACPAVSEAGAPGICCSSFVPPRMRASNAMMRTSCIISGFPFPRQSSEAKLGFRLSMAASG